jgi:hypothetical protein
MLMAQAAAARPEYVEDNTSRRSTTGGGNDNNAGNSANDPNDAIESAEKREKETTPQGGLGALGADFMKDWSKTIGKAGEWTLGQFGMASPQEMLPQYDAATQSKVDNAVKGNGMAGQHEDLFMKMKNAYTPERLQPGEPVRNNADGSRLKVNDKGEITEFTTAPRKGLDDAVTYKNIQRDEKGEIKSFQTPWGTTHSRITEPNAEGYAKWQSTNEKGQLVKYSGADSAQWFGKSMVDEKGFHNLVASPGAKQWNLYSRNSDGSYTETNPDVKNGVLKGFETSTILNDGTKVSTRSHFEKGKIERNDSVDVTSTDGKTSSVELNESKKSGKYVSPEEREQREKAASFLNFDKDPTFAKTNKVAIERRGNTLNFDIDTNGRIDQPVPHKVIQGVGPRHQGTATPTSSHLNDPEFSVTLGNGKNPQTARIDIEKGVEGSAHFSSKRGWIQRDVHTRTTGMTLTSDRNGNGLLLVDSDQKKGEPFNANHIKSGTFGELLRDSGKRQEFLNSLAKIRDNMDSLEIKKGPQGTLNGSFDPRVSEVPLNRKIEEGMGKKLGLEASNLYFKDGKLNFNVNNVQGGKAINFKDGDLQVGLNSKNGKEVGRYSIKSVVMTRDADGKPHAELELYGLPERSRLW